MKDPWAVKAGQSSTASVGETNVNSVTKKPVTEQTFDHLQCEEELASTRLNTSIVRALVSLSAWSFIIGLLIEFGGLFVHSGGERLDGLKLGCGDTNSRGSGPSNM